MTEVVQPISPQPQERTPDDAPELSVRAVSVLLLYFRKEYGEERLRQLWQKHGLGLSLDYVTTLTNFISFAFLERLVEALVTESGDPDFTRKAGRLAATPEAIGFLFHAVRTFGTARAVYVKTVELFPTLNRVGSFTIESMSSNHMVLAYRSKVTEHSRSLCEGRMAQFASVPTIWDLPPAQVMELQCQVRGADCCRYELAWHEPVRGWRMGAGLLAGVAVGTAMGLLGVGPLPVIVPAIGLGVASFGAWLDARQEVRRKDEYLAAQNEGLLQSLRDLERRYDEIYQSNVALEDRVSERTRELTEANAKLEKALSTQTELTRLKSEFFDNVSHELRTPLTLILLSLESLLQRDPATIPQAVRQHLATMERSAQRLLRLINNLLDLAQMEAGKTKLRYQPVELYGLLGALLAPFRVLAERKGIRLALEGNKVTAIHADVERIEIVFQNLISNALKFTQEGAVTVRLTEDESSIHVEVVDTGPGIAPQDIPVIFDRFAQADSTGTRRFGGTGIGLALVKETVDLHAGRISVASEVGKGSCFHVQLPKGTAHIREDLRDRRLVEVPTRRERRSNPTGLPAVRPGSQGSEGGLAAVPEETAPANAPRLLLVEDDAEIRAFVTSVLSTDYRVLEAVNGEEGCQRALHERPELIISDVMMPVMSGLQMLAQLRSMPETADIPVILLTARQEVSEKVEGLGIGANDYLGKPFSPRELLAAHRGAASAARGGGALRVERAAGGHGPGHLRLRPRGAQPAQRADERAAAPEGGVAGRPSESDHVALDARGHRGVRHAHPLPRRVAAVLRALHGEAGAGEPGGVAGLHAQRAGVAGAHGRGGGARLPLQRTGDGRSGRSQPGVGEPVGQRAARRGAQRAGEGGHRAGWRHGGGVHLGHGRGHQARGHGEAVPAVLLHARGGRGHGAGAGALPADRPAPRWTDPADQ